MSKLRLGPILDEKPLRLTIYVSPELYRELTAYGNFLSEINSSKSVDPTKLITPMLEHFIAGDRTFKKLRRASKTGKL